MKLSKKVIISILILFVILNLYLCTQSYAGVLIDDVVDYMNKTNMGITKSNPVTNIVSTILAIVQIAAVGIALINLTWVGIKYFTATATVKAELKNSGIPRAIMVAVGVFGAASLFKIVFELLN